MHDTTDPISIASSVFERINAHDLDGMQRYAAEELTEDWPIVGHLEGKQSVRAHFASLFAAMPDFHLEVLRLASQGETVFVHWRATGTFSGSAFNNIEPTGRRIELRGTDCITVRNGKIVENFIAYDGMTFAVQAGVMPKPGTLGHELMNTALNGLTRLRKVLGARA